MRDDLRDPSMFGFSGDRRFADDRSSTLFYTGLERFFAPTVLPSLIVDVKVVAS
jgi:hypothetical protein